MRLEEVRSMDKVGAKPLSLVLPCPSSTMVYEGLSGLCIFSKEEKLKNMLQVTAVFALPCPETVASTFSLQRKVAGRLPHVNEARQFGLSLRCGC